MRSLVDSPVFAATFILLAFLSAGVWYRAESSIRPPEIVGWDWRQHPQALVIRQSPAGKGCACGRDVKPAIASALSHGSETVIVGSESTLQEIDLGKYANNPKVHLFKTNQMIRPMDNSVQVYRIQNGRIVHSAKVMPGIVDTLFD